MSSTEQILAVFVSIGVCNNRLVDSTKYSCGKQTFVNLPFVNNGPLLMLKHKTENVCRISYGVPRPECDSPGLSSSQVQAISNHVSKVKSDKVIDYIKREYNISHVTIQIERQRCF